MKLSVIIPVYNEADTILECIERVMRADIGGEKELVIVDDASTDGTRELLAGLEGEGIRTFFQERNAGKGAAVRRGLAEIAGDAVVIQDADLEYNPQDWKPMIALLASGKIDVVYGSRFLRGNSCDTKWIHYFANKFLTFISNMATGFNLTDMETCYKMFTRGIFEKLHIESSRFGIEPEVTGKIARMKLRVREVGISYRPRSRQAGKKISWKDGIEALVTIFKYRVRFR